MNFSTMKRDKTLAKEVLDVANDKRLLAKRDFQIIIPSKYFHANLGKFSDVVESIGIFAIVEGERYCVSVAISFFSFLPSSVTKLMIDEEEYTVLHFEKGQIVAKTVNLVKQETLLYYVDTYFYRRARVPAFLSQGDLATLMRDLTYYTGINVSGDNRAWELLCSWISRSSKDIRTFYRLVPDKKAISPIYIPFDSVAFSTTSTTSRLSGAYLDEGLLTSANHKTTEISKIEEIIRS